MKKYVILSLLCLLFFSCKSSFISSYETGNRFIFYTGKPYCYYYNDSLEISMELYGDYTVGNANNVIDKKQYNLYKKIIEKNYPTIKKIKKENFIYHASTEIEPWIHTALFEFPGNSGEPSLIVDTAGLSTLFLTQCNDRQFVSIFTLDKRHNRTYLSLLKEESGHFFKTLKCNNDYVKISPMLSFKALNDCFGDSANYLSPVFLTNDIDPQYYGNDRFPWLQAALTYNSFMLNNKKFYNLQSEMYQPKDKEVKCRSLDNDALTFMKEKMSKHRIVIMNEQHWQPKHRYLGNLLLKNLYDNGFRYLAVEAVSENSDSLNNRKYPLQETGFYTREPQFGNFIRNALSMGFKIISYDDYTSKDRELGQAENICNNILKTDSTAKIFVWAGVAHIFKDKSQTPKMGYYLKEMTGIDPYVIEETIGDARSRFLGKHYLAISDDSTKNYDQCDLYIYNNIKESDFQIIPGAVEKRITLSLSEPVKAKIKQEDKLILMVYNKDEFDNHRFAAVPIINYLLDNNKSPSIKLPRGHYTAIVRTRYSSIIDQFDINIK